MNAYGSSVTRVSAPLWCITVLPCKPCSCCGRSGVWAERRSPAPSETAPSGAHACYCGDSTRMATSSLHRDGPPPPDGRSLGYHRTEHAHAAAGTASETGSAAGRADWRDTIATTLSSCDRGASSPFSVCSPRNPDVLVSRKGAIPARCRCRSQRWPLGGPPVACTRSPPASSAACGDQRGETAAAGPP